MNWTYFQWKSTRKKIIKPVVGQFDGVELEINRTQAVEITKGHNYGSKQTSGSFLVLIWWAELN